MEHGIVIGFMLFVYHTATAIYGNRYGNRRVYCCIGCGQHFRKRFVECGYCPLSCPHLVHFFLCEKKGRMLGK
jgi:hypothetical protein